MKRHVRLLALAAAMISGFANAQVSVSDAWVRATVPQQKATGAFLKLQAAQDSKLVAATSPLTPVVEVHEMAMQDNVMKMRQVPSIALPAGKTVELKPGAGARMARSAGTYWESPGRFPSRPGSRTSGSSRDRRRGAYRCAPPLDRARP